MDGYKRRGDLLLVTFSLVLFLPDTVRAHTTIEGLEGFGGGVVHPLMTPAHLLLLIALGLLAGQQTPLDLKTPFAVFVPCLSLALLLTTTGPITMVYQPVLIGLALCAAIPVAFRNASLRLPAARFLLRPPLLSDLIHAPKQALPPLL